MCNQAISARVSLQIENNLLENVSSVYSSTPIITKKLTITDTTLILMGQALILAMSLSLKECMQSSQYHAVIHYRFLN